MILIWSGMPKYYLTYRERCVNIQNLDDDNVDKKLYNVNTRRILWILSH